ncbi:universal stress protein [Cellulomonas sp. ATA003]|uniref:universal stress protein n=1 Tax=Cellulomonas sp. ATA003 TaxID=3073064 RepID=UPI002872B794|nr:universal stress protein [Cellulomonas sp. ATA003]WNB87260.1 universal stress protein [Cellulomonas sp. ATA003]
MRTDGPVVIALDGLEHSRHTLAWGLAEAQRRGAPVVLARAWFEPHLQSSWGWYPPVDDLALDTEAREYLAREAAHVRAAMPRLDVTAQLLHGPAVPALQALSEDAQLLVVGARRPAGHGGPGRVSGHLAAHARCPVVLVRAADASLRPDAPVVVGVDGSPSSLAAADLAAREAVLRDCPLALVHVRPTIASPYGRGSVVLPPLSAWDTEDPAHTAAQGLVDRLRERHPGLDARLVLIDDDPARALADRSRTAALLVVGSRGLGAFRGMLLGAVSNDVVRSAPGTVLVVHGMEPAESLAA